MPGLTVTEKSHGRDRIAARIDKAAERIQGRHPVLFDRLHREARTQALASLGLAEADAELEAIVAEEVTLSRRKQMAQRQRVAALRGLPIAEVAIPGSIRHGGDLPRPIEVADAITRRQAIHHDQLLADDPVGSEIARLEAEKDHLLDTIWLAVSPAQIKPLWTRVGEWLGDEPTPLERDALAIEPVKET
jgi:hypothetical protein